MIGRDITVLARVTLQLSRTVEQALSHCDAGRDFADALRHARYRSCTGVASFDDRKFARQGKKLGLTPPLSVPA